MKITFRTLEKSKREIKIGDAFFDEVTRWVYLAITSPKNNIVRFMVFDDNELLMVQNLVVQVVIEGTEFAGTAIIPTIEITKE